MEPQACQGTAPSCLEHCQGQVKIRWAEEGSTIDKDRRWAISRTGVLGGLEVEAGHVDLETGIAVE